MSALTKHEPGGVVAPTQATNEDAWLSMIERAARDPSVDVSKMERMFDMRERVMKASAEQAFNTAFVEVKRKVGPIVRNLKNDQTRSKYADLFAIADVLDPVMTEFGFAPTFGTADSPKPGFYRITGTLMHAAGHSKDYYADIPIDDAGLKGNANKTATHAFGSTLTYGRRYLKVAMFDLATTDNDGNRPARPTIDDGNITDEQVVQLQTMLANAGANLDGFLKLCKIESLKDMPASKFEGAVLRIRARQEQIKKGDKK